MKFSELINAVSYDPTTIMILGDAFDKVWSEIGSRYEGDEITRARHELAHFLLGRSPGANSQALLNSALKKMKEVELEAAAYRAQGALYEWPSATLIEFPSLRRN